MLQRYPASDKNGWKTTSPTFTSLLSLHRKVKNKPKNKAWRKNLVEQVNHDFMFLLTLFTSEMNLILHISSKHKEPSYLKTLFSIHRSIICMFRAKNFLDKKFHYKIILKICFTRSNVRNEFSNSCVQTGFELLVWFYRIVHEQTSTSSWFLANTKTVDVVNF